MEAHVFTGRRALRFVFTSDIASSTGADQRLTSAAPRRSVRDCLVPQRPPKASRYCRYARTRRLPAGPATGGYCQASLFIQSTSDRRHRARTSAADRPVPGANSLSPGEAVTTRGRCRRSLRRQRRRAILVTRSGWASSRRRFAPQPHEPSIRCPAPAADPGQAHRVSTTFGFSFRRAAIKASEPARARPAYRCIGVVPPAVRSLRRSCTSHVDLPSGCSWRPGSVLAWCRPSPPDQKGFMAGFRRTGGQAAHYGLGDLPAARRLAGPGGGLRSGSADPYRP